MAGAIEAVPGEGGGRGVAVARPQKLVREEEEEAAQVDDATVHQVLEGTGDDTRRHGGGRLQRQVARRLPGAGDEGYPSLATEGGQAVYALLKGPFASQEA